MNQQVWQTPQQKPQMELKIFEDAEIAQGHYAHVFVTGFNEDFDHYNLDFYQDTTPLPNSNQVHRRLVARIFLTKAGLGNLWKTLGDLHEIIRQKNSTRLAVGDLDSKQ